MDEIRLRIRWKINLTDLIRAKWKAISATASYLVDRDRNSFLRTQWLLAEWAETPPLLAGCCWLTTPQINVLRYARWGGEGPGRELERSVVDYKVDAPLLSWSPWWSSSPRVSFCRSSHRHENVQRRRWRGYTIRKEHIKWQWLLASGEVAEPSGGADWDSCLSFSVYIFLNGVERQGVNMV